MRQTVDWVCGRRLRRADFGEGHDDLLHQRHAFRPWRLARPVPQAVRLGRRDGRGDDRRMDAAVGPDDEIWHLGDFAIMRSEAEIARILAGLAGRKHLVAGNNDSAVTRRLDDWTSVVPYAELEQDGMLLVNFLFVPLDSGSSGWPRFSLSDENERPGDADDSDVTRREAFAGLES